MLRLFQFAPCFLFAICMLSGCRGAGSGEEIPAPIGAKGLERHSMPNIKASQLDFYLITKKDDMGVFGFYSKKFAKKGWISCRHEGGWFNYIKNTGDHEMRIRQNSSYMVLPEKKQLLMIAVQYYIGRSEGVEIQEKKSLLRQHVKVVRYQLDDRGYGMAANKYGCVSKYNVHDHGKPSY